MEKLVFMVIYMMAVVFCSPVIAIGEIATVKAVLDGDTIDLDNGRRCRLFGIDAPEKEQPVGQDSKGSLAHAILHHKVKVEYTGEQTYGREVCIITPVGRGWTGDVSVNEAMIYTGMAFAYPKYIKDPLQKKVFLGLEEVARKNRKGIWSNGPNPERPEEYRRRMKKGGGR